MSEHDIKWAVRMMAEGKRVRRPTHEEWKSWGFLDGYLWYFMDRNEVHWTENLIGWTLEDLLAMNWEIAP